MNFQAETADKSGEPGCLSDAVSAFFVPAASQGPGLPGILAAAYDPGMCLWTLAAIRKQAV